MGISTYCKDCGEEIDPELIRLLHDKQESLGRPKTDVRVCGPCLWMALQDIRDEVADAKDDA